MIHHLWSGGGNWIEAQENSFFFVERCESSPFCVGWANANDVQFYFLRQHTSNINDLHQDVSEIDITATVRGPIDTRCKHPFPSRCSTAHSPVFKKIKKGKWRKKRGKRDRRWNFFVPIYPSTSSLWKAVKMGGGGYIPNENSRK